MCRTGPAIVIANEFLDALPIRQLVFGDGAWRERVVELDAQGSAAVCRRAEESTSRLKRPGNRRPGAILELRAGEDEVLAELARRQAPLIALFIDYGPAEPAYGDTLQAVRRHAYVDPLSLPGTADLTAHVQLRVARRQGARGGLVADGPITQAEFLGRLGIAERAARLMAANPERASEIETGVQRLMSPDRHGRAVQGDGGALAARFRRRRPSSRTAAMPKPLTAVALPLCRHRPRLLHAPRRRLAGRLCQPQLRPGLQGRSGRRAREPRARGGRTCRRASLLTAHQVHSATAVVVEQAWSAEERPRADAIVTATPGLAVGVLTADCAPVLFADPEARVVAAAHAGWRGAIGGVLEATLAAMEGLAPARRGIVAAVGPCIGQAAYEVGPEFEQEFLQPRSRQRAVLCPARGDSAARPAFRPARLRRASPAAGRNWPRREPAPCTFAQAEHFFSYRRSQARKDADYGRQISAIVLT